VDELKAYLIFTILTLSLASGCLGNSDPISSNGNEENNDESGLVPRLVKDINPGHYSSNPSEGIQIRWNKFVFPASDGRNGTRLWVTDGTELGTKLIQNLSIDTSDIYSDSPHFVFSSFGNMVVFEIWYGSHSSLWSTDGITAEFLVDLDEESRNDHYNNLMMIDDDLIFTSGSWSYNLDLNNLSLTSIEEQLGHDELPRLYDFNGQFFYTRDTILFHMNMTDYSSTTIFDFDPENQREESIYWNGIKSFNDTSIIFCLGYWSGYVFGEFECEGIWISDGTTNGTRLLRENPSGPTSYISDYEVLDEKIFLAMNEHLYQLHLDSNVTKVRDLSPDRGDSVEELFVTSTHLYFEGYDGTTDFYMSDGTFEGTNRWKAGSGSLDFSFELENTVLVGFSGDGMYILEGGDSVKVADGVYAFLGITDTHLFFSGTSASADIGNELWAITY